MSTETKVFQRSKYMEDFEDAERNPGEEIVLAYYATRNSAGTMAWRVNQGMFGEGFSARVKGLSVLIRFGEKIDGRYDNNGERRRNNGRFA